MSGTEGGVAVAIVIVATAALTLAVIGLIRIPNTYVKVHAMSKGVVLGPLLSLIATVPGGEGDLIVRAVLVAAFLLATAPVAAHTLVRLERQRSAGEAPQGTGSRDNDG